MTPEGSLEESAAETQKHENGGCSREDWRGKLYQSRRQRDLHLLQRLPHQHHDQGGVVHLWTTGLWQ